MIIATGEHNLEINELQMEGKKAMKVVEFILEGKDILEFPFGNTDMLYQVILKDRQAIAGFLNRK